MNSHFIRKSASAVARSVVDHPWGWGIVAFAAYFHYAQFIVTVSWNAIELIIAQHLIDHGVFATGLDYPSAVTWRPFLPTLLVTLLRLGTSDPILIYQIYCGCTMASLVGFSFLSAKVLWGRTAGHLAAFLAFTCPALTLHLIEQPHSYSHLGAILFFGPAIFASLRLLKRIEEDRPLGLAGYAGTGALWGLCYLCRSEFILCLLGFLGLAAWLHRARRASLKPLAALILASLVFILPYNFHADRVASRDGLLIRKVIYGFYASQGWADPPPNVGPDIEAEGYLYAQNLYGPPLENRESLARAILRNPEAFFRRIRLNTEKFYGKLSDRNFLQPWVAAAALVLLALLAAGRVQAPERPGVLFLLGLFLASHFVLIFHIDDRYLTLAIPPILLLATGAVHLAMSVARTRLPIAWNVLLAAFLIAGLLYGSAGHLEKGWNHRGRNETSVPAFAALGAHFAPVIHRLGSKVNREPQVQFLFPRPSPLFPEDQFLVAYYTRTAWVNGGAEGPFPRGRIYSYRDRPADFVLAPADTDIGGKIVAEADLPILGRYRLFQLSR